MNGQFDPGRRAEHRRENAPRTPQIPKEKQEETRDTAVSKAEDKKSIFAGYKPGMNTILASVLLVLVIMTVVIVAVQSRMKPPSDEGFRDETADAIILKPETEDPFIDKNKNPAYSKYTSQTEDLVVNSGYGILIDLDTNTVVAAKGGEERIYPASMTKVMTLIVAMENIKDLDNTTYTFGAELLNELYIQGASVAGFAVGETVSARDLLYGAILPSGGDATNALAELVAGSEAHFADLMNDKVREMGLENTHFVTASGLHDDDHYSTCHDIAKILEYAISNPEMRKILSAYTYTTASTPQHPQGITLYSTTFQRLSGMSPENVRILGGKTGYTNEGRHCLCTFSANCREDETETVSPQYILVTAFAAGDEKAPVRDAVNTYNKYSES
ncbi:MAG: D-alanyl-D-alanine carboxypeptidase [Clostridia bacterium]|nr:D-alanyl-D-alanine carboxypeptidase [Clostridia bacterium]